ncbi:MAG TPA: hypothetical protein VGC06_24835 [Actinomycetes bacterium]
MPLSIRPARYGGAPPWLAISFTSGKRSKKPSITMRATARVVSIGKPMLATRLSALRSSCSTPAGAVGCSSTGRPWRSISLQTGSNAGSPGGRPAMLPSTITPTAPHATDRVSSPSARLGCCQGRLASQRIRSGQARWPPGTHSMV